MIITGRIIGYLVAGAIALVLLLYVSAKVDGWVGGNADAATTEQSRLVAGKIHDAALKWRKKLRAIEKDKEAQAITALALADALRGRAPEPTTASDSAWKHVADVTRTGAAACFQALTACQQGREHAEAENANLVAQLGAQLKVRDHPCGLFLGLGASAGTTYGAGATVALGCRVVRSPWP